MVFQYVRNGWRLLWKTPSVSALALLALALGIGATVAIFSVVDAVLLRPLPFRDADRLLAVYEKNPAQNKFKLFVAPANFREWQRQSCTIHQMAAIEDRPMNLTGGAPGHADAEEVKAERVSAGLFPMLGVQPIVGRAFLPEEDQPGHANFALLSYALWRRRFAADPAIAGKTIRLRDQSYTITGVLPAGFFVLTPDVDVFVPLGLAPAAAGRTLVVVGRLAPGATLQQARAEMDTIGDSLERADPALDRGWRPSLFPLKDEVVGDARQPLLILLGAVGLLLAIACANSANLLLARGAGRRKEIALRLALGATRASVAVQLITESLVLALAGGALGLLLARGAVTVVARLGASQVPRLAEAGINGRLLLFALAITLLTGILFSTAPAVQASDFHLQEDLMEGGRGGTMGRSGRALRNGLVVAEIGFALVVLIGAGLLMRSFSRLRAANCGFDPRHVLTFRLPLAGGRNYSRERAVQFFDRLTAQLAAMPGVRAAGAVSALPLTGLGRGSSFAVDGRPLPPPGVRPIGLARYITGDYFAALRIPLLSGRFFSDADNAQAPPVCIVNDRLARRFWRDSSPLGGRLLLLDFNPHRSCEIVGVAGDTTPDRVQNHDWPAFYIPYRQAQTPTMVVALRTAGAPEALGAAVQRVVHDLDPDQPVADLRTMQDVVDRAVSGSRFDTVLLTIFGFISFALAAVGIYGVVSYDVSERAQEIGIRIALGAERRHVLAMVVGHVARLAALGIALGLGAAFALTGLMRSMLYGVEPRDFFTYAAVSLILGAVALLAGYIPSRRALALDPVAALRHP
jgi:putative ABC transport system permease protein